jgi:hypothetical protein
MTKQHCCIAMQCALISEQLNSLSPFKRHFYAASFD